MSCGPALQRTLEYFGIEGFCGRGLACSITGRVIRLDVPVQASLLMSGVSHDGPLEGQSI